MRDKNNIFNYNSMKLELIIPTSISEIPLSSYQKFVELQKNSTDEEFIAQKTIEIFCGIELKQVVKMRFSDVVDLMAHFEKIFSEKPKFKHRFKIGNIEYGFIPKLEDISLEEFTNIEQLIKNFDTLHMALAVMYRPITAEVKGKYEIAPYFYSEDMGEAMKFCPLDVALSAQVFFWTLQSDLLRAIPAYLNQTIVKNPTLAREVNSLYNGDGINTITHLLEETSKQLRELENINYMKPLLS